MTAEERIARWIWIVSGLDPEEESWEGMMIEDATEKIRKLLQQEKP